MNEQRALTPTRSPELVPISPETRLIQLERRTSELEWVLYGMVGLVLFFVLIARR